MPTDDGVLGSKDDFEVVDYDDFEPVDYPSFHNASLDSNTLKITSTIEMSDSDSESDEDWDAVKTFVPAEEGWTDVPQKGRKSKRSVASVKSTITKSIESPAVTSSASFDPTGMGSTLSRLAPRASADAVSPLPPKPRLMPTSLEPMEPLPLLPMTKAVHRRPTKQGEMVKDPALETRKMRDAQRALLDEDKTFRARVMERKTRREMMESGFKEEKMQKMSEKVEKMTAMVEKLSLIC